MIALGVDPSSSVSGLAICDTGGEGEVLHTEVWERDPDAEFYLTLYSFFMLNNDLHAQFNIDAVVVEKVSVSWNVNTIRKIAYFEAMSLLSAAMNNVPVYQPQATKARRIVFGKGNMSKEACWDRAIELWPGVDWPHKNRGGMDVTDAVVLAMSAESLRAGS